MVTPVDDLGSDEAPLDVGVDLARSPWRLAAAPDRPGTTLVGTDGEHRQQIEQAKLQEHNDIPTLKILDAPRVPTLAVWPRKKLIVIAATMLGFILACLLALTLDFRDEIKNNRNGKLEAWQWLPGLKRSPQA